VAGKKNLEDVRVLKQNKDVSDVKFMYIVTVNGIYSAQKPSQSSQRGGGGGGGQTKCGLLGGSQRSPRGTSLSLSILRGDETMIFPEGSNPDDRYLPVCLCLDL
jgi:hypothetical protein